MLAVHGSYVAAAEVTWPSLGKLTVVSIHGRPATTPAEVLDQYPSTPPPPRHGGIDTRHGGRRFYSDLLLDTLADAATRGLVLCRRGPERGAEVGPGEPGSRLEG